MVVGAVLLDLYETTATCDFGLHARELPKLAGIKAELWNEQWNSLWAAVGEALTDGRVSVAEAYAAVLQDCGSPAAPELVTALVQADTQLLVSTCCVFRRCDPPVAADAGS